MTPIIKIVSRMIYDSRGFPTTEVDLYTEDGMFRAACPSGASTGAHEALELRDGGKDWAGKGVLKALHNINTVFAPKVIGMDVKDQVAIDKMLESIDGTKTFSTYGANAALPISMAACRAGAAAKKITIHEHIAQLAGRADKICTPVPCMNIINGGSHAGNKLAPQEYMIAPYGATSFHESMKMGAEVYQVLKGILKGRYGIEATAVGDEGGFAPPIDDPRGPLVAITEAIEKAGYKGKVGICLDVAASEFYNTETKMYNMNFKGDTPKLLSGEQMADMYLEWCREFPIISIEDPFDEDDFASFGGLLAKITEAKLPTQIVGDDLTVSQVSRVKMAIDKKACNALLLKINQVGSIMGAIESSNLAMSDGWGVMVSHRSGETEDSFIAPLVVGLGTGQIKTGAPCRSERLAKYNEIMRIEEAMGKIPYGYHMWK